MQIAVRPVVLAALLGAVLALVGTPALAALIDATPTLGLRGSATLATAQIAAQACAVDQSISVAGAPAGSPCIVGAPATLAAGLVATCFVSATNTVALRVCNHTASPITPAGSQTVNVRVLP